MTNFVDVESLGAVKYLDHGFVLLTDHMGSDESICRAARCSYGNALKNSTEDRNLIRYLFRNRHSSPFEMGVVQFFIRMPIFVARQHIRHRTQSINEYSARYSVMSDNFYIPETERMMFQSKSNKQMSAGTMETDLANALRKQMGGINGESYKAYKGLIDDGLSRELARTVLPVSAYTEMYVKMDLRNFFNYISLRDDPGHAQQEIAELAQIMYRLVEPLFPFSCEAFQDYQKNAITLSSPEIEVLRSLGADLLYFLQFNTEASEKLSQREKDELISKLTSILI